MCEGIGAILWGYRRPGRSFSWSWHRGEEHTGSIGVLVHGTDLLVLLYKIGAEPERRDGTQTVRLAQTACNYGNTPPWFVCPCCSRRAGLLFMRWGASRVGAAIGSRMPARAATKSTALVF